MYDTAIIGAGMSGLAAGIRLAYYGQRVCLLERHTTIGGLNSFYRLDGRNHDVGLHAVTNFSRPGTRKGPLSLALRQLRLTWDQFALCPQQGSAIVFPDVRLSFNNDYAFFESEIARAFPDQIDGFRRMVSQVVDYSELDLSNAASSARQFVTGFITDPLLVDMLFCPLMFYGNAREHDMDFVQFCIMFRSLFVEGLGRPYRGVRLILKNLVRKYKELGGELKLRSGVREFKVRDHRVAQIILDDGTEISAKRVISSAGWPETMRLCGDAAGCPEVPEGKTLVCRNDFRARHATAEAGLLRNDFLLQRQRTIRLVESAGVRGLPQRRDLLAQQLRLRSAAAGGHDPHHLPGQLRPLECPEGRRLRAGEDALVRSDRGVGRAVHPRIPRPGDCHGHVHAHHDSPIYEPGERRHLRARANATTGGPI